jgi:hypothetical protein
MKRKSKKHSRDETLNLVAFQLLKRGLWVSTNKNENDGAHMRCATLHMTKQTRLLVSKSEGFIGRWMLDKKHDNDCSSDLFYIFVGYKKSLKIPEFFVVSSKTVSQYIKENAKQWLGVPGKKGDLHKDIFTRHFIIDSINRKEYLNKWDLLELN